jgi:hypothetical protein
MRGAPTPALLCVLCSCWQSTCFTGAQDDTGLSFFGVYSINLRTGESTAVAGGSHNDASTDDAVGLRAQFGKVTGCAMSRDGQTLYLRCMLTDDCSAFRADLLYVPSDSKFNVIRYSGVPAWCVLLITRAFRSNMSTTFPHAVGTVVFAAGLTLGNICMRSDGALVIVSTTFVSLLDHGAFSERICVIIRIADRACLPQCWKRLVGLRRPKCGSLC